MKLSSDSVVSNAMSIVIAKYPDQPGPEHRRAMRDFTAPLIKLFGLSRSAPDTSSRNNLTDWAVANFSVWREADYIAASPRRWGPHMWNLMLRCAKYYRPKRRSMFHAWLKSLRYVLPCSKCAWHYRRMLKSSSKRWKKVKRSSHLTDYIQWMRRQVQRRVQSEQKKIYYGSKSGPWGITTTTTRKRKKSISIRGIRNIQKSVLSAFGRRP
jgi:hypothetical protein